MRRTDSRSKRRWVAHAHRLLLLACIASPFFITPVAAQILGDASPGTPGALEGELRGPRNTAGFPPPPREAPIAASPGNGKFSLQRRPNTAVRRAPGDPTRAGTDQTFSPRGDSRSRPIVATQRRPGDLSGTSFNDTRPQTFRPGPQTMIAAPAPGLGPVNTRPNNRRAPEQDPYAPLGYQMGSMLLRPAFEASAGFDTNAGRSATNRKSSPVYRVESELKASSDWSRHRLDIDLRGAFTGYTGIDNVNRPEGDARIALRLDATRDLSIDAEIRSRVDTESATSVNLPAGSTGRTPFYTHGAALGATQRFGLASIGLRSTVERQIYGDIDNGGATTSQAARNLTNYGLRLRAGYEISPGVAPFVEIGADRRDYDQRLDGSGFARSSTGATIRAGSTFELARTLTGEVGAGYTMRNYEDRRLSNLASPVADASLTWSISPLTTLNLRAQTEIAETTIAGSSGAIAYRGTATLTHAFLRNFTATVAFSLAETDYQKINRSETTLGAGLRLEYKLNRTVAIRSSYAYENYRVNVPGSNYQAHTFLTGIRITP